MAETQPKVVHLTSAHTPLDNRIFFRECRSLKEAGYEVVLVAPHPTDEVVEGIQIRGVWTRGGRLQRMLLRTLKVFQRALQENAQLYHFHDPELIPAGLVLRLLGKQVVYDIHEDNREGLKTKPYFPRPLAGFLAAVLGRVEGMAARCFHQIIAEKCYRYRFPRAIEVLNYPILSLIEKQPSIPEDSCRLLYTGTIVDSRGAFLHSKIPSYVSGVEVHLFGRFAPGLKDRLAREMGRHPSLHLEGTSEYMPFEKILGTYRRHQWRAGLAIFPSDCVYGDRELTKFFEYMALGVPIICSDFPAWRELVEKLGVGICVDPDSPESIGEAVRFLRDHPEEAQKMGDRAYRLAHEGFSWQSQARNLKKLYATIFEPGQG